MKTENEVAKVKSIEQQLHEVMLSLTLQVDGVDVEEVDPSLRAKIVGTPLSLIDALFAIRDGEPWRDLNDPGFIARKALQTLGVGD